MDQAGLDQGGEQGPDASAPYMPRPRVVIRTDLIGKTQQKPPIDPWAAYPDAPPSSKSLGGGNGNFTPPAEGQDQPSPWDAYPDAAPETKPSREIGTGEAAGRGALHGITFGTSPAIAGAFSAANPDIEAAASRFGIDPETAKSFLDHVMPGMKAFYGAGRAIFDKVTGDNEHPSPARQSYEKARKEEAEANREASEQHPLVYGGSELAASLAAPIPGAGLLKAGAKIGQRIAGGVVQGGKAGGLFGAGNAVGEGKSLPEITQDTGKGVAIGGVAGGAIGAAVGPRAVKPDTTTGQRAAATAERLEAPLPRGISSNVPFIQQTTQQARQIPWAGQRIGQAAAKTVDAAGNKVGEIVEDLTPVAERNATNVALHGPLNRAVENNKAAQNSAYKELRDSINPDQRFRMPKTEAALAAVKLARQRAGWQNPSEGLEQVENLVAQGGGFNGVHRARRDMTNAGKSATPNPGYDKGDFRRLRAAMDADLKNIVRGSSTEPIKSESLFNTAELKFGQLAQENDGLQKLIDAKGEGAVTNLFGAAKEKGGNLELLAQIKRSIPKDAWDRFAGTMLHELGHNNAKAEFSLAQFSTGWDKLSNGAKAILFSPEHRKWIDDIAELSRHIKGGDQYKNTSNTAGALILFDILKTAAETGVGVAAGLIAPAAAGTVAASALGADLLTRFLASPAKASSISRWVRAYRGVTLNQPTPARIATFKVATRNLANNVDVPFDRIMQITQDHIGGVSQANSPDK